MASRPLPDIRDGLTTTPGHPGRTPDHTWTFEKASRPLPDFREGLQITPGHPERPPVHTRENPPTTPGLPGGPHEYSRTSGRVT